jgi:hypothetical protein
VETVRLVLLFLHFIGFGALFGAWFAQLRGNDGVRRVSAGMLHGALTQLVTGIALVGVGQALGRDLNDVKSGVKLVVVVAILGLILANRRRTSLASGGYLAIGLLTVTNVALAVFWT